MKRLTGAAAQQRINRMLVTERPFKNVPAEKLRFMIGIGDAGLVMWNKKSPKYADVKAGLDKMRAELAQREITS